MLMVKDLPFLVSFPLLVISGAFGAAAHHEEQDHQHRHPPADQAADQRLLPEEGGELDAHRVDLPPVLVLKVDDEVRGAVALPNLADLKGGGVAVGLGGLDGHEHLVAVVGGPLVDQDLLPGVTVDVPDLKCICIFKNL